jgi:hypothetical protein
LSLYVNCSFDLRTRLSAFGCCAPLNDFILVYSRLQSWCNVCPGSTHNEWFRSLLYSLMFLAPFSLIVTVVFPLESGYLHKQQSPIGTWKMILEIIISKF